MSWGSAAEFFSMGGRAFYVWGSYGLAVLVIVAELLMLRARRRRVLAELTRLADSGGDRS